MTDISSVTTIYLLRHGDYENPLNIFHGRLPGFPLSTLGLEQARRLGESIADLPITAVYASPLTRTYQTAQAIANIHHLQVQTDDVGTAAGGVVDEAANVARHEQDGAA